MAKMVDHSKGFLAKAETEVEKAIAIATIRVQREAKRLVGEKNYPPASIPGEAPAMRTGTLRRSIDQETERRPLRNEFVGIVGTNLNYGKYLELGTAKLEPRPYLRPALDGQRRDIVNEIKKAGKRMSKRGT